MKLTHYKKDNEYSYTLGFFPTIELITARPHAVITVIYSEKAQKSKAFDNLITLCKEKHIEMQLNEKLVDKIAQKDNTFIIGVFRKYEMLLEKNQNHILLYQPADIGNMGMIIRSARGFNISNIGIISPGVDCFNPKVIRASMGAFFNCNVVYFDSIDAYQHAFQNQLYIFDIKGEQYIHEISITTPFTFYFGTEGEGLPDEHLSKGKVTKIPYNNHAIESLNLANSVSIALYQSFVNSKTEALNSKPSAQGGPA